MPGRIARRRRSTCDPKTAKQLSVCWDGICFTFETIVYFYLQIETYRNLCRSHLDRSREFSHDLSQARASRVLNFSPPARLAIGVTVLPRLRSRLSLLAIAQSNGQDPKIFLPGSHSFFLKQAIVEIESSRDSQIAGRTGSSGFLEADSPASDRPKATGR